jgi:CheY-like chemotaxis protein
MSDILIVDDDPRNIFALSATLRSKGYKCLSCHSAAEAIDLVKSNKNISLVLLDMMMPEMDGYEAIPHIREARPGLPVVSVTAQAMMGDREKCLDAGASDYISKPVDVDRLMELLEKHVHDKR